MNDFPPDPDDCGAASIRVLRFPECFRVRPQMYGDASREILGSIAYDETVIRRHLDDLGKRYPDVRFALD